MGSVVAFILFVGTISIIGAVCLDTLFVNGRSQVIFHSFANVSHVTAEVIQPANVWPLIIILSLLVATVDAPYFPTAPFILVYFGFMIYHGFLSITLNIQTLITFTVAAIVWCIIGAAWLGVKWWSFLRDPKNATTIKQIADGDETRFFIGRLGYLYPHFLYWPLSIPHTILTKLFYQIFEHVARRWSGMFGNMVKTRKIELAQQSA